MLGKLIKYDMKSMSRTFIPLWVLAPVVSLMLSFSIRGMIAWSDSPIAADFLVAGNGILMTVVGLLFVGVMIGLFVMTVLFVIQRFWNGLLKEEGYLMFTLPVKVWELIVSKAIVATIIGCISSVMGVLSCVVLALFCTREVLEELAEVWGYVWKEILELGPVFGIYVVLFLILMVAGILKSVYQAYASMALGQLFEGHRVVGSCVSYIGISVAISVITGVVMVFISLALPDYWLTDWLYGMRYRMDLVGILYLLWLLLVSAVQIILFHVITERVLSTKLNLE